MVYALVISEMGRMVSVGKDNECVSAMVKPRNVLYYSRYYFSAYCAMVRALERLFCLLVSQLYLPISALAFLRQPIRHVDTVAHLHLSHHCFHDDSAGAGHRPLSLGVPSI